jgi:hypothetical protein
MSEACAGSGREQTTAGGVIIAVSSVLAALLVIAGLCYASGTGARHQAALAAASCEPNLSPSGLPCTTAQMLASEYMAIMTPASQQLNTDMAAYTASEKHNLAEAEAALTAEVTSERAFDTSLAAMLLTRHLRRAELRTLCGVSRGAKGRVVPGVRPGAVSWGCRN